MSMIPYTMYVKKVNKVKEVKLKNFDHGTRTQLLKSLAPNIRACHSFIKYRGLHRLFRVWSGHRSALLVEKRLEFLEHLNIYELNHCDVSRAP